ncbi:MAG: CPBP family intramembrane metalloprotease, partial [Firmicutes bacterium HGW-Firmicutes-18]
MDDHNQKAIGEKMFQKLRKLSYRFPVIFAFVVMIIGTVLTEIPVENWLKNFIDYQSACYITGIVEQGLTSVLLVVLLSKMGLLQAAGFTRPSQWKQLWLMWPLLALSVVNGLDVFTGTLVIDGSKPVLIVLYTLLYISVGFVEEILFRGVMMTVMVQKWGTTRKGIYKAVIVSSILFGLLHLVNFAMGRYSLLAAVTQTGYALFFGVFFGACMLRNNSIWPVIFGHTLFDFFGALNAIAVGGTFTRSRETTAQNALVSILFTLPLLVYGLIILRKAKP